MSTQTWLREVRRLLDDLGVAAKFVPAKRHMKVYLSRGDKTGMIVVSMSPSNQRALRQVEGDIKKQLGLVSKAQQG